MKYYMAIAGDLIEHAAQVDPLESFAAGQEVYLLPVGATFDQAEAETAAETQRDDINKAAQADILICEAEKAEQYAALPYTRKRALKYPPTADFLDAWVKGDDKALEAYRAACLAVKKEFPKDAP